MPSSAVRVETKLAACCSYSWVWFLASWSDSTPLTENSAALHGASPIEARRPTEPAGQQGPKVRPPV